jgi:hypothetical protein
MKNLFTTSLWAVAGLSTFVQVRKGEMDCGVAKLTLSRRQRAKEGK